MKIYLTFIWVLCASLLCGQTEIKGKIIDKDNSEPVAYALIRLNDSNIGVFSDEQGNFSLSIDGRPDEQSLTFSYIGYKTKNIKVRDLPPDGVIILENENFNIEAVVVSPPDPDEILRIADSLAVTNHFKRNTVQPGFYREFLFENNVPMKVSEATFDRLMYGSGSARKTKIKTLKARSVIDSAKLKYINDVFNLKKDTIQLDVTNFIEIGQAVSFTSNTDNNDKRNSKIRMQNKFNGHVEYLGREAYDISYQGFKGKKELISGRFLIDTETYAYLAFEAYLNEDENLNRLIPFGVRFILNLLGYNFSINNVEYKVYTKPIGNKFFFDKSVVLIDIDVARKGQWIDGLIKQEYYMADPVTMDKVPDLNRMPDEQLTYNFNNAFWGENFYLPTPEKTLKRISRIERSNAEFEGYIHSEKHERWMKRQRKKVKKKQ